MDLASGSRVLQCSDGLDISFHRTTRVPDHEDPTKQTVATVVDHSPPCDLVPWPPYRSDKTYLLALDCPPDLALDELQAFGIRASTERSAGTAVKMVIKVEGENIAVPPTSGYKTTAKSEKDPQPYFFLPNLEPSRDAEWIHGIAVKEEPRLVRQFVVRNDGSGASIQNQVTGSIDPDKLGVVHIEATFEPYYSAETPSDDDTFVSEPVLKASDLMDPSPPGVGPEAPPCFNPMELRSFLLTSIYRLRIQVNAAFSLKARAHDGIIKAEVMPFLLYNIQAVDDVRTLKRRVSEEIHQALYQKHGAECDIGQLDVLDFRLAFNSEGLAMERSLASYNIREGDTVDVNYWSSPGIHPPPPISPSCLSREKSIFDPQPWSKDPFDPSIDFLPPPPALPEKPFYSSSDSLRRLADIQPLSEPYLPKTMSNSPSESFGSVADSVTPPPALLGERLDVSSDLILTSPIPPKPPPMNDDRGKSENSIIMDPDMVQLNFPSATKKLEVVPGGLIRQRMIKDPGTIRWDPKPKATFTIRIVNFQQFRNITGREPLMPPPPPTHPRRPHRDERNAAGTDGVLVSNAECQSRTLEEQLDFELGIGTLSVSDTSEPSRGAGASKRKAPDGDGAARKDMRRRFSGSFKSWRSWRLGTSSEERSARRWIGGSSVVRQ